MLGTNLSHSAFSVLTVSSAETLMASSIFEVMFIPGMWRCSSADFNGLSIAGISVGKIKILRSFVSGGWLTHSLIISLWRLCRWYSINKMVFQKMFQIASENFKWKILDWRLRPFLMHKSWFLNFSTFSCVLLLINMHYLVNCPVVPYPDTSLTNRAPQLPAYKSVMESLIVWFEDTSRDHLIQLLCHEQRIERTVINEKQRVKHNLQPQSHVSYL